MVSLRWEIGEQWDGQIPWSLFRRTGIQLIPRTKKAFVQVIVAQRLLFSRGDKTAIELFLIAIRGWEAGVLRHFSAKSDVHA